MLDMMLSFGGKTHEHFAVFVFAELFQYVGRRLQAKRQLGRILFDLLRRNRFRPVVKRCSRLDDNVGIGAVLEYSAMHIFSGSNTDNVGKLKVGRSRHQYNIGSALASSLS